MTSKRSSSYPSTKKPLPPNPIPSSTPTKKNHKKKKSKSHHRNPNPSPSPSTLKKMSAPMDVVPPPPSMASPATTKKRKSRDHDDGGDSLTILEAVIDFQSKNRGANPTPTNMTPLYESVRDTLHVDYTQGQLYNRIRHLRQKFYGLLVSGDVGPAPADRAFFDLSLRAWGDSKKRTPTPKVPAAAAAAAAAKPKAVEKEKEKEKDEEAEAAAEEEDGGGCGDEEMEDAENGVGAGGDSFKYLTHQAKEYWRATGLTTESLEMGLRSMDRAKAKLLERKWVQHGDAGLKIQAKQSEIERDLFLALHATRKGTN